MQVNWPDVAPIVVSLITLFVGVIVKRAIERKPRLIYYIGHVSSFTLRNYGETQVFTHSIVIRNYGKKSAEDVKIGHNYLPNDFTIFPSTEYEIVNLDEGKKEIKIANFVPKEQITVSYLYFPTITWDQINTYVKHKEGFGKAITMIPTQLLPKWLLRILVVLLFLGVYGLVHILFEIIPLIF